jgi:CheY-like chemotaxis protein
MKDSFTAGKSDQHYDSNNDVLALIRLTDALNVLHTLVDYSAKNNHTTQTLIPNQDFLQQALALLIKQNFFEYCLVIEKKGTQPPEILASASIDLIMPFMSNNETEQYAQTLNSNDLLPALLRAANNSLSACFDQQEEYQSEFDLILDARGGTGSLMAIPFSTHIDTAISHAYLVVLSDSENTFDQWHLRILRTFTKVLSALFISHQTQQQQHEKMLLKNRLLEHSRQLSEDSSQANSDFLSDISDQVRAPMNAVFGISQALIQDKTLNGEQRRSIHTIFEECSHLLNTLNDAIDSTEVETVSNASHIRLFELQPLLDEMNILFELRFKQHQLDFKCINHCPDDYVVKNDLETLRQLLIVLFDHALHHSQQCIRLHILHYDSDRRSDKLLKNDSQDELLFALSYDCQDSTALNNSYKINHLFDQPPDTQTDTSQKVDTSLHLAKKYSQQLQAKLWLDNDAVPNWCFKLCLPSLTNTKEATHKTTLLAPSSINSDLDKRSFNVLVVDDVAVNRVMLGRLLLNMGAHVWEASDGMQAIDVLKIQPIDIVFMDIKMPVMCGDEALLYIRQHISKTLPCIAVTAKEVHRNTDGFTLSSFDQVICKPFSFDQIYQNLYHYIH